MRRLSRRRFLATSSVGLLGALAGCPAGDRGSPATGDPPDAAPADGDDGAAPAGKGTRTGTATATPTATRTPSQSSPQDFIPAITEPAFAEDWSGVEREVLNPSREREVLTMRLEPDDDVIGVERGGGARAYPLKILNYHEVVNDSLGGPLLVSYCPLCRSGVTAVRTVKGQETVFGVSGRLINNNLVMYDELTQSLWSQIEATAVGGPQEGETLTLVPSTLTTWEGWRTEHPDTEVLRPPPESNTVNGPDFVYNYTINPYGRYNAQPGVGYAGYQEEIEDDRLFSKALVLGIEHGGVARAYPFDRLEEAGVVNDEVGGLPVVVAATFDDTLVGYERTVDGEVLTFEPDGETHMTAGGSRWKRSNGEAVDGPHEGTRLDRATDLSPMFWFAWTQFNEGTEIYGEESVETETETTEGTASGS